MKKRGRRNMEDTRKLGEEEEWKTDKLGDQKKKVKED